MTFEPSSKLKATKNHNQLQGKVRFPLRNPTSQSWLANGLLVLFAILYCLSAILAPFWSNNDSWSNLLPIIHFRHSILDQHMWPAFTDLWYGGRSQWENPLWSFLYFPSTIVWLITPLDWGTRIVFLGHFTFSLLIGRKLAALFLRTELERISTAILLSSPIMAVLAAGHLEKVMSWGWILLAVYFLFNEKLTFAVRGLGAGICLGIVPLTGANYYTLYAGILLVPLILSYKNPRLIAFFFLGSLIGLLHIPNIRYMVGHVRMQSDFYIDMFDVNILGAILSLAIGFSDPMGWETWAAIGIPMIGLFFVIFAKKISLLTSREKDRTSLQNIALSISIVLLFLLASGIAYRGNDLFDLFRVPARALAFIALAIVLYILINVRTTSTGKLLNQSFIGFLIFTSALQVSASAWLIRPRGSLHSPYENSVQRLADTLKADQAKSVWISMEDISQMYIQVGLTRNNLALPNVYYGDMGQFIDIKGNHCGYSFDHLVAFKPITEPAHELIVDIEWSTTKGEIPLDNLLLLNEIRLNGRIAYVYRVICNG